MGYCYSLKKGEKKLMNIKPYDKTIREVLVSGRQFLIPRFQREYSWERKNYKEFLEDMIGCLYVENGKLTNNQYFLGTMLFIGDYAEGTDKEIQVVDGQQRLTTITILFSALSDRFLEIGEDKLSKQIFRYIMTEDDNGDSVRILKSKTHYPFFAYYIQQREKEHVQDPLSEEEYCIEETYTYFYEQLEEKKVRRLLTKRCGTDEVKALDYVDILKAIRDQVLQTTFVSISTTDKEQANMIFEILNAKGKRLAEVDLIKNKIFEVLNDTEPADFAEEEWQKIKGILNGGAETVGLATFYRHFWSAKYKKSSKNKLYDDFNKCVTPKNKKTYMEFLLEMEKYAKYYMMILNPKREDYENRKEYFSVVQMLNVLNNYFGIVQVRIAEVAILNLKDRGLIDLKNMKKMLTMLETFHFVYNAVMKGNPNSIEKIYSSFAIESAQCEDKAAVKDLVNKKMVEPLEKLLPQKEEFTKNFVQLQYSKKDAPSNVKTKYVLNKLNCYYEQGELFSEDGSVEHIIAEAEGEESLNIGNLILLEVKLNQDADTMSYSDKVTVYKKSKYKWVKEFVDNNSTWTQECIENRALQMAHFYYDNIVKTEVAKM